MSDYLTLGILSDISGIQAKLVSGGLSPTEAENKAKLFSNCAESLKKSGNKNNDEARAFFVPGRIEVLGKHTDYAGGRSVVCAVEKGFCIIAVPRNDRKVRIYDTVWAEKAEFEIAEDIRPCAGHWSNYPMTTARRIAGNFQGQLRGADIAFASDLPAASGISSSSAMIVGFFMAFSAINELASRKEYLDNINGAEELAGYLGTIENGQSFGTLSGDKGVGTFGGSEDHTAILCCRSGMLSQYSYCPVMFERFLQLPQNYVFVIASSGIVAEKTGAALKKYNRISKLSRFAVEIWNKATGRNDKHPGDMIKSGPDAIGRFRNILSLAESGLFEAEKLLSRIEHFVIESEQIIPAAGNALANADMAEFGSQVKQSQEAAEKLLGNQVPETIFLARIAYQCGAIAASAFGAGFGGSVWALTEASKAKEFAKQWSRLYNEHFPDAGERSQFMMTRPGPAAFELK